MSTLFSLFLAIASFSQVRADGQSVMFVLDGDTILLTSGEKVRYLGIDAPEMDDGNGVSEPLARASKDFNRRLLTGKTVKLAFDQERRDDYGRLLAYVFLGDGRMVNALMVQEGFAAVMSKQPNTRHRDDLLAAQREAMRRRRGIWEHLPEKEDNLLLGNGRSFRFHRKGCSALAKLPAEKQVRFRSRYEAFWAGFSPCKRCKPSAP